MADNSFTTFEDQVKKTSAYFSSLVELIPAKYYLPDDAITKEKPQDLTGVTGKAAKQIRKQLAKKAKLLKLDPSKHKTIGDLQKEIEAKEKALLEEEDDMEMVKQIKVDEITSLPLTDLRQKLHDRMELLRGKRKIKGDKKAARNAKKRKVEKDSKMKKSKEDAISNKVSVEKERKATQVLNDRGDVVFSKFDFAGAALKKKKKNENVEQLLKKAEKKKTNLEKLEGEDKEKAEEVKSKIQWGKALKQAEGQKVKDDPKLLMKTLKRKQKMKEVSKKKWDDRIDTQKKMHEEKQKKRRQNLKERKAGTKDKKHSKKGKKHRPGF
eukprot:gene474-1119_t